MTDKVADLAGPGIGTYEEVDAGLPNDYASLLSRKDTQIALWEVKKYIEDQLCKKLNLFRIESPLIVEKASGMNDYLDRDGSRTPIDFTCGLGLEKRMEAQVVQAATKWKRFALKQFECDMHEGILTDMRAVRKDYFLDHDHSSYVDQWDWEQVIAPEDRNLDTLHDVVKKLWSVFVGADELLQKNFPKLSTDKYPAIPKELKFLHAEEILDMFPDLPRKQRETAILQKYPAVFIIGIGHTLEDGYPHEMRAADYDDWTTPSITKNGKQMHGLNGDILVWNPVTKRRHELSSMGIRVTKDTLVKQLKITGQEDFLNLPYHKMIMNGEIPLSIGGGIGQSRTYGYLLRKAALGECSVTVWPQQLHDVCAKHNIHLLR
jgi:aspartate--ammonia ligase